MLLDKGELILTVNALYDSFWTFLIKVSLLKSPLNVDTAGETLVVFIIAFTFVVLRKTTHS